MLTLGLGIFHHSLKLLLLGVLALVESPDLGLSFLLALLQELLDLSVLLGLLLLNSLVRDGRLVLLVALRLLTFAHRQCLDMAPELGKLIFGDLLHLLLHF